LNSGLVSARKYDTALELVRDEGAWRSAEKLDEPDVARDPVGGPLRPFTMPRFQCSRCRGFGVHDAAVSVFTIA